MREGPPRLSTVDDLLGTLEKYHISTPVPVTILRDSQKQTVIVVLQTVQ